MEPVDPRDLRISDADRHRVAELLREAAGEGRLDLDELDQRLESTYAAKTYGDLVPLTLDLPGQPAHPVPPAVRSRTSPALAPAGATATWRSSLAIMSETRRSGVWTLGASHTATAFMGSVVLDLREALFSTREVVINANAVMGSVEVVVGYGTAVVVDGWGVMGAYAERRTRHPLRVDAGSPVVRVRGLALMGSVEVRRRESSEEKRRRHELGH